MNIMISGSRILVAVALAATLSACATWDEGQTSDSPYYESYGYPDDFHGPGYYGPGYYQPGYYGGYWYGGGYYSPSYPGGYYAPYPYYPGTHVVIVDRNNPPPNRSGDGDTRHIPRRPGDPRDSQPQGRRDDDRGDRNSDTRYGRRDDRRDDRREPEHPFGIPDRAYNPQDQRGSPRANERRRDDSVGGARGGGYVPTGPRQAQPPPAQQPSLPSPTRAAPPPPQIYRQAPPEQRTSPAPERSGDRQPVQLER